MVRLLQMLISLFLPHLCSALLDTIRLYCRCDGKEKTGWLQMESGPRLSPLWWDYDIRLPGGFERPWNPISFSRSVSFTFLRPVFTIRYDVMSHPLPVSCSLSLMDSQLTLPVPLQTLSL